MTPTEQVLIEIADLLDDFHKTLARLTECMSNPIAQQQIDMTQVVQAITQGLGGLSVTAPPVEVRVEPPQVNLSPQFIVQPPASSLAGWKLSVTSRDDLGRFRELTIKPE